jgi:methionine synthase I (cobalamin-dependent)/5,10-methylenetetrahydrofolate reductase
MIDRDFKRALSQGVVIGDGALGTELLRRQDHPMPCPEALLLEEAGRQRVAEVHRDYVAAGAQLLETDTFAANPRMLEAFGLADRTEEINRTAVAVCRSAAGPDRWVAGSVGPLDWGAGQSGSESVWRSLFARQMDALAAAGVDLFILETFSSTREARAALAQACSYGRPVCFCMGGQGFTRAGGRRRIQEMAAMAGEFDLAAVGLNCLIPYDISELLPLLRAGTDLPLMALPNGGSPGVERGVVVYDLPTGQLLTEVRRWLDLGVALVGGCCGTTPNHIQALAAECAGRIPVPPTRSAPMVKVSISAPIVPKLAPPNPLREVLKKPGYAVAVEMRAELNPNLSATLDQALALSGRVTFFDVPDNPGGNLGRDSVVAAALIRNKTGVPGMAHKAATQSNLIQLYSQLVGAWDLGVSGILAVTGDPPSVGPFDRLASRVTDLKSSVDFLEALTLLRRGELLNGQMLREAMDFVAGCAFAPGLNRAGQTRWLERKLAAGAELVFSQPIFTRDDFLKANEAFQSVAAPGIRFLPGLFPLAGRRQVSFLRSGKIPGIAVPDEVAARFDRYEKVEDQAQCGLDLALELAAAFAAGDGIYLVLPFHARRIEWALQILDTLPAPIRV